MSEEREIYLSDFDRVIKSLFDFHEYNIDSANLILLHNLWNVRIIFSNNDTL